MASRYKVTDQGVAMVGFANLAAALNRIAGPSNFGLSYELRRRLALIGAEVAREAPQYVSHKTGRHSDPDQPALEDSVKVSVTMSSASIYSTAIYGGVQNVGGQVGREHHTLLRRAEVSAWMNKAVSNSTAFVEAELQGLLDWLVEEFEAET